MIALFSLSINYHQTQLAAYRAVKGNSSLSYSHFEELEAFYRFGTRLDEATQDRIR